MNVNSSSNISMREFGLGSRKFQFVADAVGLPIDQINFLFGQIFALLVAYLFRVVLHPNHVSAASRHWTALSAGLCISYFCFGKQVLLAIFLVIMCYCILNLLPPTIFHHATLCASITFLSTVHIQRLFYEEESFSVDITGPLMIVVQKATSLAYSLNDGLLKDSSELTPLQEKFLIKSKPSALEYFSYLLCFHSILAGPFFMFTDYRDFIEGTHFIRYEAFRKRAQSKGASPSLTLNNNFEGGKGPQEGDAPCKDWHGHLSEEPCPNEAALGKAMVSLVCSLCVVTVLPLFPIRHLAEQSFLRASFFYKLAYIVMTTTIARQVYYTAWYLADSVCNLSGFGFSGFDERGKSKWDLVSNVSIVGVEFGTSLKSTLDSWNTGTMKWLRFLVYERAPSQKTLLTYLLSSIWHGFFPGYYLSFLGGAFFTIVSRTVRRSLRPRVLRLGDGAKRLYDFATFLATRLCLSYITFPFVMLRFWPSIYAYNSLLFYLHSVGLLTMLLLPLALPPLRAPTAPLKEAPQDGNANCESLPSLNERYSALIGSEGARVKKEV